MARLAARSIAPDQEAYGLGISALRLYGNKLSFDVPGVDGSFEGTLDNAAIHGIWKQGKAALKLDLARPAAGVPAQASFNHRGRQDEEVLYGLFARKSS